MYCPLWSHLLDMRENKMAWKIFIWGKQMVLGPRWRNVCVLFCNYGFGEAFFDHEKFNICMFRESVFTQYIEQWTDALWTKRKPHMFRMIKSEYGSEKYVENNLTKRQWSRCAELRPGISPLMTEICQFGRRNGNLSNVLSGSFVSCCLFYKELRSNIVTKFIFGCCIYCWKLL